MKAMTMEEASELVTSLGMRAMAESGRFTGIELDNAQRVQGILEETYKLHKSCNEVNRCSCHCPLCRAYMAAYEVTHDPET